MTLSLAISSSLTEPEIHCGTSVYRVWLTFSWENIDLGIIPLLSILTHETYLSTILSQLLVSSKLRVQTREEVGCLQTYIQKDFIQLVVINNVSNCREEIGKKWSGSCGVGWWIQKEFVF